MHTRRTAVLAAAFLLLGAESAVAADPVKPRPGVELTGQIKFPRPQRMTIQTGVRDGSKLTISMGFDGRCRGGGIAQAWAGNIPTRPAQVRARDGKIDVGLDGTTRNLGGVQGRTGVFQWRLTGRFVERTVVTATVTGTAQIRVDGKTVSRCKIARPMSVRLATRS